MDLHEKEIKYIEDFRVYLVNKGIEFPSWYFEYNDVLWYSIDDNQRIILRFLQGNHFKFKQTADDLKEHVQWKILSLPVPQEAVSQYLVSFSSQI